MKQTLTQRVKRLEKYVKQICIELDSHGTDLYHLRNSNPEPYTAQASTGELTKEQLEKLQIEVDAAKYQEFLDKKKPQASMGECARCGHNHEQDDYPACTCCNINAPQPIKPQEDLREAIASILRDWLHGPLSTKSTYHIADKILKLLNK
jgi:hypothetical protein